MLFERNVLTSDCIDLLKCHTYKLLKYSWKYTLSEPDCNVPHRACTVRDVDLPRAPQVGVINLRLPLFI